MLANRILEGHGACRETAFAKQRLVKRCDEQEGKQLWAEDSRPCGSEQKMTLPLESKLQLQPSTEVGLKNKSTTRATRKGGQGLQSVSVCDPCSCLTQAKGLKTIRRAELVRGRLHAFWLRLTKSFRL